MSFTKGVVRRFVVCIEQEQAILALEWSISSFIPPFHTRLEPYQAQIYLCQTILSAAVTPNTTPASVTPLSFIGSTFSNQLLGIFQKPNLFPLQLQSKLFTNISLQCDWDLKYSKQILSMWLQRCKRGINRPMFVNVDLNANIAWNSNSHCNVSKTFQMLQFEASLLSFAQLYSKHLNNKWSSSRFITMVRQSQIS